MPARALPLLVPGSPGYDHPAVSPSIPPAVRADLHEPALRDYWRARVQQVFGDLYAGVPIWKFPEDLRVYEHLLWLDAPEVVVELGTYAGGSTLWFRDRLHALVRYGRVSSPEVIAVDLNIAPTRDALTRVDPTWTSNITLLEGDVRDPALARWVREAVAGRRCFIVEDTAHTEETTRAALDLYAPLIRPNGFMVVEDGCVDDDELRLDGWPRGVLPALEAWLRTPAGGAFSVRRELELYGVTTSPSGILQRIS
jgi:cephalosporin hydroxylase